MKMDPLDDDIAVEWKAKLKELELMLDEGRIGMQEYFDMVFFICVEAKRKMFKRMGLMPDTGNVWTEANQEQAEGRFERDEEREAVIDDLISGKLQMP
jgi:hypothetical protein